VEPVETLPRVLSTLIMTSSTTTTMTRCVLTLPTAEAPKLKSSERSGGHLRVAPPISSASASVAPHLQTAVNDAVNCNNDLVRVVFATRCNQHDRLLKQAADVLIERAALVNCATRLPWRTLSHQKLAHLFPTSVILSTEPLVVSTPA
jgi:hypothetical protein